MSEIYLPAAVRSRNATLGSETLIYFERLSDGRIIIPPVHWASPPPGYVKMEANSSAQLEKISRRFEAQKQSEWARVDERRCALIEAKHKEIRGRLQLRMKSAGCGLREKDFIRAALKKLEEGEKNLRQRRVTGNFAIEAG